MHCKAAACTAVDSCLSTLLVSGLKSSVVARSSPSAHVFYASLTLVLYMYSLIFIFSLSSFKRVSARLAFLEATEYPSGSVMLDML